MNRKGQVAWIILGVIALIALPFINLGCNILGGVFNWGNRAVQVVSQEVDPAVLLQKYMWFKDASASLDSKVAGIKVFQHRTDKMLSEGNQTRDEREAYNLSLSELDGMKQSYNDLASEYNSQMSKLNWRFCNVGQLPQGATDPLPREYKPYQEE